MKIIHEGSLEYTKKILRFKCRYCQTLFEADDTEYQSCGNQIDNTDYKVECPLCKQTAYYSNRW